MASGLARTIEALRTAVWLIATRDIYLYVYVYKWGSLQLAIKIPFFLDMTAWASCFPSEGAMFWDADAGGLGQS